MNDLLFHFILCTHQKLLPKIRKILKGGNSEHGGKRKLPSVFTENGVAMLSSVLNSPKSIQVNIAIMRIFTKLRSFLLLENQMNDRMDKLEENTSKLFKIVFERMDSIEDDITPHLPKARPKIGFKNKS